MRHRLAPLFLIIISVLLLLAGNLYVTRHAFSDMEHVLLSQRTHYKYNAMTRMAVSYYTQHNSNEIELSQFLEGTIASPDESYFLARYEPSKGFPIIWSHTTPALAKYQDLGSIENVSRYVDSMGVIPYSESIVFIDALKSYSVSDEARPLVVTNHLTDKAYLIVWTIIESPSPSGAKYVYYSLTPVEDIVSMADAIHDKYLTLFVISICLAAGMLVLIPMTVQRLL